MNKSQYLNTFGETAINWLHGKNVIFKMSFLIFSGVASLLRMKIIYGREFNKQVQIYLICS